MIKAVFEKCENYTTAYGLYQWDYGQTLEIYGIDTVTDAIEAHFTNAGLNKALVVPVSKDVDHLTASIPNTLLETGENITVYVYIDNDVYGKTVKTILLPVKKRVMPEDYNSDDPSVGGIIDYEKAVNKPRINDIELMGNKTSDDLLLQSAMDEISEQQIDQIIFGGDINGKKELFR